MNVRQLIAANGNKLDEVSSNDTARLVEGFGAADVASIANLNVSRLTSLITEACKQNPLRHPEDAAEALRRLVRQAARRAGVRVVMPSAAINLQGAQGVQINPPGTHGNVQNNHFS